MSSRLMPPKVGEIISQKRIISSTSCVSTLDVEDVDVGKALEENALAFHDRLAGECADVAKAEDSGAVAKHGDEVALGRVLVGVFGVLLDRETGRSNARGVGQREIVGGHAALGRDDLYFTCSTLCVIFEGVVVQAHNVILYFSRLPNSIELDRSRDWRRIRDHLPGARPKFGQENARDSPIAFSQRATTRSGRCRRICRGPEFLPRPPAKEPHPINQWRNRR